MLGDCKSCKHYENTDVCEDCEHYRDLTDRYEPAAPEILAKQAEEEIQGDLKRAIGKYIPVVVSDEFRQIFNSVKRCTADHHFREVFLSVLATDCALVASDTHCLIEYRCTIPQELIGKCIVTLNDERAGICLAPYPNFEDIMYELQGYHHSVPLNNIALTTAATEPGEFEYKPEILSDGNNKILLNGKYLKLMREILTGNITVKYHPTNPISVVVFIGDNCRMAIVPMRDGKGICSASA